MPSIRGPKLQNPIDVNTFDLNRFYPKDAQSQLTLARLYHGAPVSNFFSGAMADVLKADDNQTGTAALGSSREPLF